MGIRLYDLADHYRQLDATLDAEEGVTEDEAACIAAIRADLDAMTPEAFADAIRYLRSVESDAVALKAEVDRLSLLRARAQNKVTRIKGLLAEVFESRGVSSVKTPIGTVALQNNGGEPPLRLLVTDPMLLPDDLVTVTRTPNNDALRSLCTSTPHNPFAVLDPRGKHVRIR